MEKILKAICTLLVFGAMPSAAYAASLLFSPAQGSYAAGDILPVSVYVASADQPMNAISATVSFPKDKLEATSISKNGSILTLWVQDPSFSNTNGTVSFEGIVPNPGFIGESGKVLTINFKVKTAGIASLSFLSGSVLANDGRGTNILKNLGNTQFSLGGAVQPGAPKSTTSIAVFGTPQAPVISSPTHPDPMEWYATSTARFTWPVPTDATGARLLIGSFPNSIPTVTYNSAINSKEITDLKDGIWYFSAQLRNSAGWGDIAHFRIQIDTQKPDHFIISEVPRTDAADTVAVLAFDAEDKLSGVDHYEISIDGGVSIVWTDDSTHDYHTPALAAGAHVITVNAVDRAGNTLEASTSVVVQPIDVPVITNHPAQLNNDKPLVLRGITYPKSTVTITLQKSGALPTSFVVESDTDGKFTFASSEGLSQGTYELSAYVVDSRGAKSAPSEKLSIVVSNPPLIQFGVWTLGILAIVVPLLVLVFMLTALVWYGTHTFSRFKRRVRKETEEAETVLHKAVGLLKDDVYEQIKKLEEIHAHRELTPEEKAVLAQLKRDLDTAEAYIGKEIEDIKRVR